MKALQQRGFCKLWFLPRTGHGSMSVSGVHLMKTLPVSEVSRAALVGIILGCEIDADDKLWLKSILPADGRIKLYRAKKREREFGLDIQEL